MYSLHYVILISLMVMYFEFGNVLRICQTAKFPAICSYVEWQHVESICTMSLCVVTAHSFLGLEIHSTQFLATINVLLVGVWYLA